MRELVYSRPAMSADDSQFALCHQPVACDATGGEEKIDQRRGDALASFTAFHIASRSGE